MFYLDPPYVHNTREMTFEYKHEMDDNDHERLVNILLKVKGKCILSGYDTPVYNKLLDNNWEKVSIGKYDKRSEKSNGVGERGVGEEFVWVKHD